MKILFFFGHPAHYHLFKNVIKKLCNKNHKTYIAIKEKDILEKLLISEKWDYQNIQPNSNKKRKINKFSILFSSGLDILKRDFKLFRIVNSFKPDLMLGTEASIAHVGRLLNIPSVIVNEDDAYTQPEFCYPSYPFANNIMSPSCASADKWEYKKVEYEGYHELAYLHPNVFIAKEKTVKEIVKNKFFIVRFVKLTASHDVGKTGITNIIARRIIKILEAHGEVFITSERELEPEFEKYRINLNPNLIHHALCFANLIIADSQTMIAEAAVLGTPSIRFSDFVGKLSYLEELEHKYGLTYGIKTSEPEKLYQKIEELLQTPNLKQEFQRRRQKMLSEKIDVTAFMVWFIENYPESVRIMKEEPDYQYRFK